MNPDVVVVVVGLAACSTRPLDSDNTDRISWPTSPPDDSNNIYDRRLASGFAKQLNVYADEDDQVLGSGWSHDVVGNIGVS